MFVVGIDGGGTKTRVAVCASDGTLLHRETLGAFNLSAIGEDGFRRRVGEILTLCGDMRACGALCVGGAGASGAAMGEILRAELAAHGFAGKLLLCGDHEIALAGAMQTPSRERARSVTAKTPPESSFAAAAAGTSSTIPAAATRSAGTRLPRRSRPRTAVFRKMRSTAR